MLVSVVGPGVRVDEIIAEIGTLTAQEWIVEHLKPTGLRVGLVTDGERWTLVSFKEGASPGFATWSLLPVAEPLYNGRYAASTQA